MAENPTNSPAEKPPITMGSPEYAEALQQDIDELESVVLPGIGQKMSLLSRMPAAQTAPLEQAQFKAAHEKYGELMSKRMALFLVRANERAEALAKDMPTLKFAPVANEKIKQILLLFKPGKPNRSGEVTTPLLMQYQGITRVHIGGKALDAVHDIDQLMAVSNAEQQAFLQRLRGLLINEDKGVGDVSWSADTDGLIDMDPIAKAELAYKQAAILQRTRPGHLPQGLQGMKLTPELLAAKQPTSKLAKIGRFAGMIAAGGLAIAAFLANKRQVDWPVAMYGGLALLAANGMPKGKFDNTIDQLRPLLSSNFRSLAEKYKFREQPEQWAKIAVAVNTLRTRNVQQFNRLMKPIKEGKTPEEKQQALEAFVDAVAPNDAQDAKAHMRTMSPEDLENFCSFVSKQRTQDARLMLQQFFAQGLGPHTLEQVAPQP